MTKHTTTSIIVSIVALALIVGFLMIGKNNPQSSVQPPQSPATTLCYFTSFTDTQGYKGTYYARLAIEGTSATGELATFPPEKDSLRGTLSGEIVQQNGETYFDGSYLNEGEGMTATDERMIKLSDTEAAVGYGDIVQNSDGTFMYKDKSALNYSLTIPKVDCAEYDNLKAQAGH